MKLADKIKELRVKQGINTQTLSERSGIPLGSIRAYERSSVQPSFNAVLRLARAFNVDLNTFADCETFIDTRGRKKEVKNGEV